jgi:hypothetical protein
MCFKPHSCNGIGRPTPEVRRIKEVVALELGWDRRQNERKDDHLWSPHVQLDTAFVPLLRARSGDRAAPERAASTQDSSLRHQKM